MHVGGVQIDQHVHSNSWSSAYLFILYTHVLVLQWFRESLPHFEYLGLAVIRQDSPFLLLEMNPLPLKQENGILW